MQARVVRVKTVHIPRTAIPALLEIRILLSIAFPGSADASFLNEAAVRPDALKAWSQRARGQTDWHGPSLAPFLRLTPPLLCCVLGIHFTPCNHIHLGEGGRQRGGGNRLYCAPSGSGEVLENPLAWLLSFTTPASLVLLSGKCWGLKKEVSLSLWLFFFIITGLFFLITHKPSLPAWSWISTWHLIIV